MARAPFQVLVFPYMLQADGAVVYAVLRRADAHYWQGIAGGGEDGETPLEAAQRETWEEAGIPPDAPLLALRTTSMIPVTHFPEAARHWGRDVHVIPQHFFGVLAPQRALRLSHEHSAYRWEDYEAAAALLKWDDNKTALWELNRRVRGLNPWEESR